jgi:uncharacterized membrane protein YdjX (TVP38/TMEM64 family)
MTNNVIAPLPIKRLLPLVVIAALMAVVFGMGWHEQLTLENIVIHRARFQAFLDQHKLLAVLAYVMVYATAVALSLPGGLVLTLTGGLMFGWLLGAIAAVVAATLGATIVFLIAKTAFGETLAERAGPTLAKLQDGFKQDALSYLLFLRLVPAFPFFLVNLAPALLGISLRTYLIATFIGIVPATFAIASVGAGLDRVIATAEAKYGACVAVKGAALCKLSINLSMLINKQLGLAFVLLGCVALIPVIYKKWRNRHATTK